ncbi:MAG: LLM class flavin-dependent oxidoreductase [Pseudolysinimonas sp.]|uniref:LLM class flavin-dependent oxidoreductase n=1 Tax=Pseudolysinimonas sp. TaxID=2680009 RepID=UPI003264236B
MSTPTTARSIGLAGTLGPERIARLAVHVEAAGYRALWVNDNPGGDSLAPIAAAAQVTTTLGLATGIVPLDRVTAAELGRRVGDLPHDRIRIGVGSGNAVHGLALLEAGIAELRAATDVPVLIGALGPRTRRLAARVADGILFNWLSPVTAALAMAQLATDTPEGRPVGAGVLYARTIVEPEARAALEAEAAKYAGHPAYSANFARLGITPLEATIDLGDPESLEAFQDVVDELVLRVITATGTDEEIIRVIEAGAPA